jgi:hypothetical protein
MNLGRRNVATSSGTRQQFGLPKVGRHEDLAESHVWDVPPYHGLVPRLPAGNVVVVSPRAYLGPLPMACLAGL